MINIPDIEKERVQRIPKELQSSFFLKRLISEEQYSFFHTKYSNADEKSAWVWNMTGDTLAVFRRLYDRKAEKWIEFCTFQIEIQNNSEQHRVWLYTNNDHKLAPQIERAAKTINVLFDCWLGVHNSNTIKNESGIFICDERGNLVDFQPNVVKPIKGQSEIYDWPSKEMLEAHRHSWTEPEYILHNLCIPDGVYSIGLEPDIYRDSFIHDISKPYCFENCVITGQLTFPPSLRIIGPYSFMHSLLCSVTLNSGIYGIGNYAFSSSSIHILRIEKDFNPPSEDLSDRIPFSRYVESVNLWLVGRQLLCRVDNLYVSKNYPYKWLFSKPLRIKKVFDIDTGEKIPNE